MENGVFTLKTHQMFYVVNYAGEIWKRNNYICHVGCMRLGKTRAAKSRFSRPHRLKSSLFVTDQPNRRTAAFLNSFGVVWMDILGANLVEGGGWAVSKPNFLHSTTEK